MPKLLRQIAGTARTTVRRKSAWLVSAAVVASVLAASPALSQQQTTATFDEVIATYDKAEQATFGNLRATGNMSKPPSQAAVVLPKGSDIYEVQVYGTDQAVTGLRLVYKDGANLMMTPLLGSDGGGDPKAMRLRDGETIATVRTKHTDDRLTAIMLETSLGRSLLVGAAAGDFNAQAYVIGRLFGFSGGTGPSGLTGPLGALIQFDTPSAQKIAKLSESTGAMKDIGPDVLGYDANDHLVTGSTAGASTYLAYSRSPGADSIIPRDAELAQIIVYGDTFINGVQLGYRYPGTKEIGVTRLVGSATGPLRRINVPPGRTVDQLVTRDSGDRAVGIWVTLDNGEELRVGKFDSQGSSVMYGKDNPNRTYGLVGLNGTLGASGLTAVAPIRLPAAVGPVSGFKGMPGQAASGCAATANAQNVARAGATPLERMTAMRTGQIGVAAQFAIPLDATQSVMAGRLGGALPEECRYDITGIWATKSLPSLRPSNNDPDNKIALYQGTTDTASGDFVDRSYMVISAIDPDRQITVRDGMSTETGTMLDSTDGKSLRDVLDLATGKTGANGAPDEKTYAAGADRLTISVGDINGKTRILWRGKEYTRPIPVVLQPQALAINDTFTAHQALDNLPAARRGYDIALDDPFRMNENTLGLLPIFDIPDPKLYSTIEKVNVPLGSLYVPNGGYAMSFTETLITNQSELQKSVSNTYGASIGYGGKNNQQQENAGKQQPKAAVAVQYSETESKGNSSNQSRSIAMSVARDKKYAIILDRPFARLDPDFVQALYDFDRDGNIATFTKKYGTHYPYAITYGAAAKSVETFSHQETANWATASKDLSVSLSGSFRGVDGSVSYDRKEEQSSNNKVSVATRNSDLKGLCATNKEASGLGKECPILFDLRPIPELLNAMNFPNDVAFAARVRKNLEFWLNHYLDLAADRVKIEPPPQVWQVSMSGIKCTDVGQEAVVWDKTAELRGKIAYSVYIGEYGKPGFSAESATGFDQSDGEKSVECDGKVVDLLSSVAFWGTPDEIRRARVQTTISDLAEIDGGADGDDPYGEKGLFYMLSNLTLPEPDGSQLNSPTTKVVTIDRGTDTYFPKLELQFTFKRIK